MLRSDSRLGLPGIKRGLTGPVFMNQHGVASAASLRRVKRAVAAKQSRLNTVCNPGLLKDFTFGLTSNFFHTFAGTIT